MLPTDSPEAFPEAQAVMPDPRVMHYWDSHRVVGARYKNWVPSTVTGPIEWDAFYLYPADAVWTGEAPPAPLVAGRTILETRRSLEQAISRLSPLGLRRFLPSSPLPPSPLQRHEDVVEHGHLHPVQCELGAGRESELRGVPAADRDSDSAVHQVQRAV